LRNRLRRASHPGVGITVRLVTLVLLPVTLLCAFAGTMVLSREATATQADAVEGELRHLTGLVDLRDALRTQQSLQAMTVRLAQLGVTPAVASQFLGIDLAGEAAKARIRATTAVTALGGGSPIHDVDLRALSRDIDFGVVSPADALVRLTADVDVASASVRDTLSGLDLAGREARIVSPIEALEVVTLFEGVATAQGLDLSALWFPAPGATPKSAAAVFASLARNTAVYDATVTYVRRLAVASVVDSLDVVAADPGVERFTAAVAAELLSAPSVKPLAKSEAPKVAAVFRGFLLKSALLRDVVAAAAREVRDVARKLATDGRSGLLLWGLGTAILASASIGVALLLARSVSRPLKQLAAYAHAVNEGDLHGAPAVRSNHGPRETRLAFRAFGDLVASLRLLDAKANALAHCDFADPVLKATLPGRLGQSLQSSVMVLSDSIIKRDELQAHLSHQANHDSLTGLYNRPAAVAGIQEAIDRANRTGAATAVLFVDLDDFKQVNDRHGHEVGDTVLQQVAARMHATLRSGDFVARFGGDEFVVVAQCTDVVAVTELGRRLVEVIDAEMQIGSERIVIGASVGIALSLDGPEDPIELIARADAAMYRAKQHHGSAIELFDAELQAELMHRVDIEAALGAALALPDGGGLSLSYQPILDAATEALFGVEALVRWDRPGHGMLPPDAFIPIAESTDLIVELDCWVLDEVARQLLLWDENPVLAGIPVSVNISGRHLLSRRLPAHISSVLARTGIAPERMTVEITETVVLDDLLAAADELEAVRALGVKVAIDDFGTGYTSLAQLQQLPIDTIKIDRSFVSQLDAKRGRALVRMVTVFGRSMDITVVAEGVETAAELSALQGMGADHVQGFLLSRPLRPDALATWATHVARTRRSSIA
jgi:diguanylate cyclase (GGDEF)-like protein